MPSKNFPLKPQNHCGMDICVPGSKTIIDEEVLDILLHDHALYAVHSCVRTWTGYVYCLWDEKENTMRWHEEVWTSFGLDDIYRAKDLQPLIAWVQDMYGAT